MKLFKLNIELHGHSKDVRGVSETKNSPTHGLASVSRDQTIRLWAEDQNGKFAEKHCLRGHTGFVSSVASLQKSKSSCLVFTGGQDKMIRVTEIGDGDPRFLYALEGHTNTVCALYADERSGFVVSGSWDGTARLWLNRECKCILSEHSQPVWAVCTVSQSTTNGAATDRSATLHLPLVLTGSADKSVILWKEGRPDKIFEGHTDCVRALAVLSEYEFLSAGNDATIRRWNLLNAQCTMIYYGHESFIYSISIMPVQGDCFVSGAEDSTVRLWHVPTGECRQTLLLPAQSVWSVTCLSNGDFACGASDGVVRIFTCDQTRQAEDTLLEAYDQQVSAFANAAHSKDEIGGYKISDLPGKEALNEPGKKEGQTKMVRNGTKVELYQWSAGGHNWEKVGDVLNAANPTDGKKMHKGKEYDYVFDVDVEDGKPPLKLPYNVSDDPWMAAQQFINDNMLPQVYIDEVVQFIMKNAPEAGKTSAPVSYSDPFTGENRYVPGGIGTAANDGVGSDPFTGEGRYVPRSAEPSQGVHSDPFTGANRYMPAGGPSPPDLSKIDPKRPRGEHMLLLEFIDFTTVSAGPLQKKLLEFNELVGDQRLSPQEISLLDDILSPERRSAIDNKHMVTLEKALRWNEKYLIPVLDVFRLAILTETCNNYFFDTTSGRGNRTFEHLCHLITSTGDSDRLVVLPQLQILVCRGFTNAIAGGKAGRECVFNGALALVPLVMDCLECQKGAAQVAAASLMANMAAMFMRKDHEYSDSKHEYFLMFGNRLKTVRHGDFGSLDPEAVFRLLQTLVTYLWGDELIIDAARTMELNGVVGRLKDATDDERSKAIARSVERMLS